jgi:hypothetical protein
MIWVRKPKFERRVREELALYSTAQLRERYDAIYGIGTAATKIRLRDSTVTQAEAAAEIRWREWRENSRFWVMLIAVYVGAVAAIIAAVEGWPLLK